MPKHSSDKVNAIQSKRKVAEQVLTESLYRKHAKYKVQKIKKFLHRAAAEEGVVGNKKTFPLYCSLFINAIGVGLPCKFLISACLRRKGA